VRLTATAEADFEVLFTLHVARKRRRGRHFILFRADTNPNRGLIDVLRILHDAMDLERHVPDEDDDGT
jgi:toxin ParE1/3/4